MNNIGVKDLDGVNVCLISRKSPLPKNFYNNYTLVDVSFIVGDGLAHMRVMKNGY